MERANGRGRDRLERRKRVSSFADDVWKTNCGTGIGPIQIGSAVSTATDEQNESADESRGNHRGRVICPSFRYTISERRREPADDHPARSEPAVSPRAFS